MNSIGNGVAKKLICITHGDELSGGIAGRNGGYRMEGDKGKSIATTVIA